MFVSLMSMCFCTIAIQLYVNLIQDCMVLRFEFKSEKTLESHTIKLGWFYAMYCVWAKGKLNKTCKILLSRSEKSFLE